MTDADLIYNPIVAILEMSDIYATSDTSDTSDTSETYTPETSDTLVSTTSDKVTAVQTHAKLVPHNDRGLTWPHIRRLARRGGVAAVAGVDYRDHAHLSGTIRASLTRFLTEVVHASVASAELDQRTTVTRGDVLAELIIRQDPVTDMAVQLFVRHYSPQERDVRMYYHPDVLPSQITTNELR